MGLTICGSAAQSLGCSLMVQRYPEVHWYVGKISTAAHYMSVELSIVEASVSLFRASHRVPLTDRADFGKAGRGFKKGAMFGYEGKEHEVRKYANFM